MKSKTKQSEFARELAEVKSELHELIVRDDPRAVAKVRAERENTKLCAEMDARMGLNATGGCVRRSVHELSVSVLGNPDASPPRGATSRKKPIAAPPAAVCSVTSLGASAAEMDARMGTRAASPSRVRREGNSLVFGVGTD